MSKSVANVVIATDTFEGWIIKTNILLDALSNEIITVAANTTGAVTSGNASINGTLSANTFVARDSLRGGTVAVANTLTVTSNVINQGVSTFNANLVVNTVANVYMTSTSTTIRGGALAVTSNTVISAASVDISTSGQLTLSAAGGMNITGSMGNFNAGVVNATSFVGIGQGFSNMNVVTSNTTFTVPSNVYKIRYVLTGGGGGGGSAPKQNSTHHYAAGGGGGGGSAIGVLSVTPGESITVTIGGGGNGGIASATAGAVATTNSTAGETSSIVFANSLTITATGGGGGADSDNTNRLGGRPAAGGAGSGGTINLQGGTGFGGYGQVASWAYSKASIGGSTVWGDGAASAGNKNGVSEAGANGVNYGTGGSGGQAHGTSADGGNGASGVLLIEY